MSLENKSNFDDSCSREPKLDPIICFSIFATQKGAALKSITLERIFAYFLFLVGIATLIESILK
jgi:hypothetical protein